MTDDLFAALGAPVERRKPVKSVAVRIMRATPTPPPPPETLKHHARDPVASYACPCGARDEVLAPGPPTVDCWRCKAALSMVLYVPRDPPPSVNARKLTAAERERMEAASA